MALISGLSRLHGMPEKLVHCFLGTDWRILNLFMRMPFFIIHFYWTWINKIITKPKIPFYQRVTQVGWNSSSTASSQTIGGWLATWRLSFSTSHFWKKNLENSFKMILKNALEFKKFFKLKKFFNWKNHCSKKNSRHSNKI